MLGHFHETADENSKPPSLSARACTRIVVVRAVLFLVRVTLLIILVVHAVAPGADGGGFDRARAAEMRSIHAGNHAGCCASRVEIERRWKAIGAAPQKCQTVKVGEKNNRYAPAFTRDRLDQG